DAIAHASRTGSIGRNIVRVVPERCHPRIQIRERSTRALGIHVSFLEQTVSGVTDGFVPRAFAPVAKVLLPEQIAHGSIIIGCPCIIHGYGKAEEITCLHEGIRSVNPDRSESLFIPDSRDA